MKLLILGGTGMQAESIVLDLLEIDSENIDEITLASRNAAKLKARVEKIGSPKLKWEAIDIDDHDALVKLMEKHDLVCNTANTPTIYTVVRAALDAKVSLLGLEAVTQSVFAPEAPCDEFGFITKPFFDKLNEEFNEAGVSAVLGWGYVPGITTFIGRMLADKFDTIDTMVWSYASKSMGDKLLFSETPKEMIWLHHQQGIKLENGKYVRFDPKKERCSMVFPDPIGNVTLQHMSFMSTIPVFQKRYVDKKIQNMDVRLGYWPGYIEMMDFMDSIGMLEDTPRDINGVTIAPVDVFLSGRGVGDKEGLTLQDYGCVHFDISGVANGRKVSYSADIMGHPQRNLGAMQIITGIPVAVGIQMAVTNKLPKKGYYTTMDDCVDPHLFFEMLSKRGFTVNISRSENVY